MNLELLIAEVLTKWSQTINARIEARWGTMVGVAGEAINGTPTVIPLGTVVTATLTSYGMKAWMCEFGSGSEADTSNPYLESYTSSPNFNHYRSAGDMTIRGRDEGEYFDLDGQPQYSSGHNAGKDLELKPVYTVMLPMHVIQFEVESAIPDIIEDIQTAVRDFTLAQLTMETQIYI
jgi:hypothetical protein